MEVISAISALLYIFFSPGLIISFLFFKPNTISLLERVAISFALSITTVPTIAFYLNTIGIKISVLSIVIEVLVIILLSGLILMLKNALAIRKVTPIKTVRIMARAPSKTLQINSRIISMIRILSRDFFQLTLVAYLVLLLMETIHEGYVSYFLDLNIVLIFLILTGLITLLTSEQKKEAVKLNWDWKAHLLRITKKTNFGKLNFYFCWLISLAGGLFVYSKTSETGAYSLIASILTMGTIFLFSYHLFTEQE